jgi:hypothetical protein
MVKLVPIALAGLAIAIGGAAAVLAFQKRNIALTSKMWYRPVIGRMYSFNTFTLPNETPTTIGNAIAGMAPSFVSGLIRMEASNLTLTSQMISDLRTVESLYPGALYDIWLRPTQYTSASALASAITTVLSQVGNMVQVVSFDNYDSLSQDYQTAIVQTCHASNKLVLGDVNPNTLGPIYVKPDIIGTSDWNFVLGQSMPQIVKLGLPVLLHVNNGPEPVSSTGLTEHYIWNNVFTTQQREQFIQQMVQLQGNGFAYMYNLFWPEVSVQPPVYYDCLSDDQVYQFMQSLAQTYNRKP